MLYDCAMANRFAWMIPFVVLALGACSNHSSGSQKDAGIAPLNHRASDAQCQAPAAAGSCACSGSNCTGSAFTCVDDGQCVDAGVSGRCANSVGPAGCYCTFDRCTVDTDCPGGETCACHDSPYVYGEGNACVLGGCRVDADCGKGGYCSPSQLTPCMDGGKYCLGYYCHTAKDKCTNDSDCTGTAGNTCAFSPNDGYWKCQTYFPPV